VTKLEWLAFLVAAALGAPARYILDAVIQNRTAGQYPWGTFIVNITGSFALGVLTGFGLYHGLTAAPRTVLGTGGLGAFTTFSTFGFETVRLAEQGALEAVVGNVVLTLAVGITAAAAGLGLAILV
jgi:CrcB protein